MTKPTHSFSVAQVLEMSEVEWLSTVAGMAFPERAGTMVRAAELAKASGAKSIVETGCIRGWAGDGQSTLILVMLAIRLRALLDTFDINVEHIANAKAWLGDLARHVAWNHTDSVEGLSQIHHPVDFVYLDSCDYQRDDPVPCQLHQLAEVGAIYGKLSPHAVIVMDDASLDGGGKVALALRFLKDRGWKEAAKSYQIVLTR